MNRAKAQSFAMLQGIAAFASSLRLCAKTSVCYVISAFGVLKKMENYP